MKKKDSAPFYSDQKILFGLAIVLFVFSLIARFGPINNFLPFYSLDENELTEYALALFGPDKDPHWYKYGPLYWYVLKFIYGIQITLSGVTSSEFVQEYFFSPSKYFSTSRYLAAFMQIGLGALAFLICKNHFNKKAALIAFCIAIVPIGDSLTAYLPRIDTLLALNVALCLYFALFLLDKRNNRSTLYFVLTAIFLGLSVSSKPIPSLLILPAIGLTFYLRNMPKNWSISSIHKPLVAIFTEKGLYIFLIVLVATLYISNPYSFKSFDMFWAEQVSAVQSEGSRNFESGLNIFRFSRAFGYVFLIFGIAATLYAVYDGLKRKKYDLTILAIYILTYWAAFAMGAARNYFYVTLVAPLAVLIAYYLRRVIYTLNKSNKLPNFLNTEIAAITCILIITVQPLYNTVTGRLNMIGQNPELVHTQKAAQKWVDANIPQNSKILYYGYYTSLVRLIDNDINEQAQYGDFFMYGRGNNKYWIDQYSKAHKRVVNDTNIKKYNIIYNLTYQDTNGNPQQYYTRYKDDNISKNLFALAGNQAVDYIFTTYDLSESVGPYSELNKFDKITYKNGPTIHMYKRQN